MRWKSRTLLPDSLRVSMASILKIGSCHVLRNVYKTPTILLGFFFFSISTFHLLSAIISVDSNYLRKIKTPYFFQIIQSPNIASLDLSMFGTTTSLAFAAFMAILPRLTTGSITFCTDGTCPADDTTKCPPLAVDLGTGYPECSIYSTHELLDGKGFEGAEGG